MITLAQQVRPHPDVVDTEVDTGEMVLLHLNTQTYYSLNVTGTRIWQGVKEGLSLQAVSHRLQDVFDVDMARADDSVLALVNELLRQQLVQRSDA